MQSRGRLANRRWEGIVHALLTVLEVAFCRQDVEPDGVNLVVRVMALLTRGRLRRLLAASMIAGTGTLLAGCAGSGRQSEPSPLPPPRQSTAVQFPDTTDGIHIGLAFDYQISNPRTLRRNVDYIWGGYSVNSSPRFGSNVHHGDVYLPFDLDAYPQSFRGHSLNYWKATHPDWIVYRCDRRTPAYYGSGDTNVPLDFSNPAVRAYEVREAATAFREGAGGVGFDDFSFVNYADRCGVFRRGVWTPLGYPGAWQDNDKLDSDMILWLSDIRSRLHARFPSKTLGLNMDFRLIGPQHLRELTPYVDFIFNEAGFTSYGSKNITGDQWQQEVQALEYLNSRGKAFDVNGIVGARNDGAVTPDQINWVLANYLLVKGRHSFTYIYAGNKAGYTGSPSGYGTFYNRPQYHVPIGHPTSGLLSSHGAEVRFFSGGLALVNPSASQPAVVPLGETYRDMFGHSYSAATLAPASGIVLLKTK
jgi:hypothetical protein